MVLMHCAPVASDFSLSVLRKQGSCFLVWRVRPESEKFAENLTVLKPMVSGKYPTIVCVLPIVENVAYQVLEKGGKWLMGGLGFLRFVYACAGTVILGFIYA